MSPKKVVIDCDAGTDDAQAIMMTLAHPATAELVAVTTVFGTATVENTSRNVLRVLNVCHRLDIPVYRGCSTTLLGNPRNEENYHGNDGLGNVPNLYPPGNGKVQDEHAVNALIRLAKENPGELTLIATGPLTNLGTALKLDPDFGKNLKEVCIMGGNSTGRGNVTVCAEFNFYSDPEAAQYCLNHLNTPVTLVPTELCEQHSLPWEWYDIYSNAPTEKARFIKTIDAYIVKRVRGCIEPLYNMWDQLAAAIALDNSVITKSEDVYATIELTGTYTRGQVVIDWRKSLQKPTNVRLVTDVDDTKYSAMLSALIGRREKSVSAGLSKCL